VVAAVSAILLAPPPSGPTEGRLRPSALSEVGQPAQSASRLNPGPHSADNPWRDWEFTPLRRV